MKIEYTVDAHANKEGAIDDFEDACDFNGYTPTKENLLMAKYVGYDFSLGVDFDTETGKFEVVEIIYGEDIYTLNKRD